MAKKSAKRVKASKNTRSTAAMKRRKPAKKAAAKTAANRKNAAKKPARPGGSRVDFGLHGIAKIMKMVHEAGLESEFNDALGHDDKFVKVQKKSLRKIKDFVDSKPELAGHAVAMQMGRCDCDPNDPYCIYI